MAANDLTAPEQLIVDRLTAELGTEVKVIQASPDIDTVAQRVQIAPAIHVIYAGYDIGREQGDGIRTEVELLFAVLTVVKQVRGSASAAGPLMAKIITALAGWSPGPGFRRLHLVNAGFQAIYEPGMATLPLAFTTRIVTEGKG